MCRGWWRCVSVGDGRGQPRIQDSAMGWGGFTKRGGEVSASHTMIYIFLCAHVRGVWSGGGGDSIWYHRVAFHINGGGRPPTHKPMLDPGLCVYGMVEVCVGDGEVCVGDGGGVCRDCGGVCR